MNGASSATPYINSGTRTYMPLTIDMSTGLCYLQYLITQNTINSATGALATATSNGPALTFKASNNIFIYNNNIDED